MTAQGKRSGVVASIEPLSKVVVAVISVIYAFGLVVVTLHLSKYGVSGLSLLRAQYLLAGVWALLPIVFVLFVTATFVGQALHEISDSGPASRAVAETGTPKVSWRTARHLVGPVWKANKVVVVVVAIAVFLLSFASKSLFPEPVSTSDDFALTAAKVAGFATVIGLFGTLGVAGLRAGKSRPILYGFSFIVIALIGAVGYAGFFVNSVFPQIPQSVGGGKGTPAQVILKDSTKDSALIRLLHANEPLETRCQVMILTTTDKGVIFLDPRDSSRAVVVVHDQIAALQTSARLTQRCSS